MRNRCSCGSSFIRKNIRLTKDNLYFTLTREIAFLGAAKVVLQQTNHEANVPFVEKNGVHTQADIVFTDADGREVAVEVKSKKLPIATKRLCACEPTHINCLTAKEWIKCQLGVRQS